MKLGQLDFVPVGAHLKLIGWPVQESITKNRLENVLVAEINPAVSDTQAFCDKYGVGLDISVNCVIVEARRAERTWYAVCLILATVRADINGVVRRALEARKVSFASTETATMLSKMEYGGICPIGLPDDWPILIDAEAAKLEWVLIGSGVRQSKLLVPGKLLASLPNAKLLALAKN